MAASVGREGWCSRLFGFFLKQDVPQSLHEVLEEQDISSNQLDIESDHRARLLSRSRVLSQIQQIAKNNLLGLLLGPDNTTLSGVIKLFLKNKDICNLVGVHRAFLEAEENKAFLAQRIDPFSLSIIRKYRKISLLSQPEWERTQVYFPSVAGFICDGRDYGKAKITDDEVIALVEHFPQLTEICLYACDQITSNAALAIAKHCSKLRKVSFMCSPIQDVAVMELVKNCPDLEVIDLRACPVTDTALKAIAKHCQHLKWIDLYSCKKISETGVKLLVKSCPSLMHIDLCGCSPVIENMVPSLRHQYPTLRVNWR